MGREENESKLGRAGWTGPKGEKGDLPPPSTTVNEPNTRCFVGQLDGRSGYGNVQIVGP